MMILATRSAGKLRELVPLFAARGIRVVSLHEAGMTELPEEDKLEVFPTFEANALAKAEYFHALTRQPTVADDSGLVVAALGGDPGIMSKRWSGRTDLVGQALDDENNRLLLERLHAAIKGREYQISGGAEASYVCAAAYADGSRSIVCRGETAGYITEPPRGVGGFGYDAYFQSAELGCTFAEATGEAKERVSHRGRAFRALLSELARLAALGREIGYSSASGS